jgi:hypothetical protein
MMEDIFTAIGALVATVCILVGLSMVSAGIWFCFDDRLAEYTGVAILGELPFTFVWPATLFVMWLFKGRVIGGGNGGE